MRYQPISKHQRKLSVGNDRGSVTAELAMALPAVALIISITLGAFALQIERMKLVDVAAVAARAVARGESEQSISALVAEMTSSANGQAPNMSISFEVRENMTCAQVSQQFGLPGLGENLFDLVELQCARKMGL